MELMAFGLGNSCSHVAQRHNSFLTCQPQLQGVCVYVCVVCINMTVNVSQPHVSLEEFHLFYLDVIVTVYA